MNTFNFDLNYTLVEGFDVNIDVEVEYDIELYGVDADGNRGMEAVSIESVRFKVYDPKGQDMTSWLLTLDYIDGYYTDLKNYIDMMAEEEVMTRLSE